MQCAFCKEEIKDGAIKCKHCGSMLIPIKPDLIKQEPVAHTAREMTKKGNIAFPIVSMGFGIIAVLGSIGVEKWDRDIVTGLFSSIVVSVILGIICVIQQESGRGMAIAGIVLGGLGLLISLSKL